MPNSIPQQRIEALVREFEKGYYSFRFEYTDKDGKRRYEVCVWNDGMPPEKALKYISRHVSEYDGGKLTDFIENKYFKDILKQAYLAGLEDVESMERTVKPEGRSKENYLGYEDAVGDILSHISQLKEQIK